MPAPAISTKSTGIGGNPVWFPLTGFTLRIFHYIDYETMGNRATPPIAHDICGLERADFSSEAGMLGS